MSPDFICGHVKHYKVVYCLLQNTDIDDHSRKSHVAQQGLGFELLGFKEQGKNFGLKTKATA